MKLPFDIDAAPVAHRSPYRRIDPAHPDRKAVMTRAEMVKKFDNGAGASLADVMALYCYDAEAGLFYLKEEFL